MLDTNNRPVAVFDLDGTLAIIDHRRPLVECKDPDWKAFYAACVDDLPNPPVIRIFHELMRAGYEMVIASGRSSEVFNQTVAWLWQYIDFPVNQQLRLIMRREGDTTPDDELKRMWLHDGSIPRERVAFVFDDRDKVVAMWRNEGLTCFQVAPGAF